MNTLEDIKEFGRLKSKYEDASKELEKFLTLMSGTLYFNGHSSRDLPSGLLETVRKACAKYFYDEALENLNQLEFLNFDVKKEKEALKLRVL